MEHGSLKNGLLIIPKREAHGNTIYDATSTLSVTLYFDATRCVSANCDPVRFELKTLFSINFRVGL